MGQFADADRKRLQQSAGLTDDEIQKLTHLGAMNLLGHTSRESILGVLSFEAHEFDTLEELDEALSDPPTDEQVASAVEAARRVLEDTDES